LLILNAAHPSVLDCLKSGHRELAETILDSGDTLLTILGDILDFSKIDHNRMTLESAPVREAIKPYCSCLLNWSGSHCCTLARQPIRQINLLQRPAGRDSSSARLVHV
jgi:signal transduction histidine kinase